ncbi:MAG: type I 3-dehydroquinate dehydratase [Clostridiales bacterium]|nr:type I 3-dehydroquinate dehydratase [Clostridiales bacterium]HBM81453.1 type I 3-dehydroquinate dehydratase [Clostridiaceae bacterium]
MNIKTINIKGKIIGGDKPLICIPIMPMNNDEVVEECEYVKDKKPDMVEWRADFYSNVHDLNSILSVLDYIKRTIPQFPLIFALRSDEEGGHAAIEEDKRIGIIDKVIRAGLIDIVDIEIQKCREIIDMSKRNGIYTIVSYYNFKETPKETLMLSKLVEAQNEGADIVKIAVKPKNYFDVIALFNSALTFKEKYGSIPEIDISMSRIGNISRFAGVYFGSSVTFASGLKSSDSGKIPIEKLRMLFDTFVRC